MIQREAEVLVELVSTLEEFDASVVGRLLSYLKDWNNHRPAKAD